MRRYWVRFLGFLKKRDPIGVALFLYMPRLGIEPERAPSGSEEKRAGCARQRAQAARREATGRRRPEGIPSLGFLKKRDPIGVALFLYMPRLGIEPERAPSGKRGKSAQDARDSERRRPGGRRTGRRRPEGIPSLGFLKKRDPIGVALFFIYAEAGNRTGASAERQRGKARRMRATASAGGPEGGDRTSPTGGDSQPRLS